MKSYEKGNHIHCASVYYCFVRYDEESCIIAHNLCRQHGDKHKHSATILEAIGMYSGENRYMVVSVMNIKAVPALMSTMQSYPDDFVYFTDGVRVQGDFHFRENEDGQWTPAYK